MEWKPIKTAPKNDTAIDIWSMVHGRLVNYERIAQDLYGPVYSTLRYIRDATHWMPLPRPPKEGDK